jgi:glyoxylase-like metal-dependent hydrolase (beta-lactamase superfamily II)
LICASPLKDIEIYSYPFPLPKGDANMYVLLSRGGAIVVDPNESSEAVDALKKNRIERIIVLLTHEHIDHISGVNMLRKEFDCHVICSAKCGKAIKSSAQNLAKFYRSFFCDTSKRFTKDESVPVDLDYICEADETFEGCRHLDFYGHSVLLRETPGHSQGSICIVIDDCILFSGDSLLPDMQVVTRLPGGSKEYYQQETVPFLESLPTKTWVFPGHGVSGKLDEMIQAQKEIDSEE